MMQPEVIAGFTGTNPNNLTGFSTFQSISTGIISVLPSHYRTHPDFGADLILFGSSILGYGSGGYGTTIYGG